MQRSPSRRESTAVCRLIFSGAWNGTNIPGATNGGIVLYGRSRLTRYGDIRSRHNQLPSGWTLQLPNRRAHGAAARTAGRHHPAGEPGRRCIGGQASFQVAASGSPPLSYRWMFLGTNLLNATNSSLVLPSVQLLQAGTYCAQVASPYGTNVSSNAHAMALSIRRGRRSGSTNREWTSVACSTDGTHVLASSQGTLNGLIYTSADSGATWRKTTAPTNSWSSVASSADGSLLVAAAGAAEGFGNTAKGFIYTSTNYGSNWLNVWTNTARALRPIWSAIACSTNGGTRSREAAAARIHVMAGGGLANDKGLIFTSANSGSSWTQTLAPTNEWISAACSADGSVIVAAVSNGLIYASTDSGNSWNPTGAPSSQWTCVASSADGSNFVAASTPEALHDLIYVSTNSGAFLDADKRSVVLLAGSFLFCGRLKSRGRSRHRPDLTSPPIPDRPGRETSARPSRDWTSTASSADGSLLFAAPGGENQTGQIYSWEAAPTLTITPAPNELLLSWPTSWDPARSCCKAPILPPATGLQSPTPRSTPTGR